MTHSSVLFRGMVMIAISVLLVIASMLHLNVEYTDPLFAANYFPYEAFLAVVTVILWYVLLRKDIPLSFKINFNKTFFITLPIFLISLSIFVWTLVSSKSLDYQTMALFFGTAVSVGIAEELIFRVAGYRALMASGSSAKRAILLSAVLFSLFHLTNLLSGVGVTMIIQLLNTFMLGVVFAYIYYKTRSILYVMLLHFMWDFSSFVGRAFGDAESLLGILPFALTVGYFIWALTHTLKLEKG